MLCNQVHNCPFPLSGTGNYHKPRANHRASATFSNVLPDNNIGQTGFIFCGHEDYAFGAPWSLANFNKAGYSGEFSVLYSLQPLSGGEDPFGRQFFSQQGERVTTERKAHTLIIGNDIFALAYQ